jgi:hypothetical protein
MLVAVPLALGVLTGVHWLREMAPRHRVSRMSPTDRERALLSDSVAVGKSYELSALLIVAIGAPA